MAKQFQRATVGPMQPAEWLEIAELLRINGLPLAGLVDHGATAIAARMGRQVIGCAALELYGDAALLRSVAVASDQRGYGIGTRLLHAATNLAIAHAVQDLYLLTETATEYFHRRGFVPLKREHVPDAVRQSVEFTRACPASAQAMHKHLEARQR